MAKLKSVIKKPGFSLVELILAIALFSLFATALVGLLWASFGSDIQAAQKDQATIYAQQGLEAVWSIRRQGWNLLVNGSYGLTTVKGFWELSDNSDSSADGFYTRVLTIADACRSGGDIVDCAAPAAAVDLYAKKVTSTVTYVSINKIANNVTLTAYLTAWPTKDWNQVDWSGGGGQSLWSDITKYDSDDGNIDHSISGQVSLAALSSGGCGVKVWPFTTPTDYLYDPAKIEVSADTAHLVSLSSPVSGQTLNPGFTSDLSNWTHAKWGTFQTVSRTRVTSGGNPGAYLDHRAPRERNTFAGGYDEQAFTVTTSNPTASVSFDWRVTRFDDPPDSFKAYVFVDNFSGEPIIGQEVWSSGELTGLTSWQSVTNLDVSSKITTPGTYYLKIAIWVDYSNLRAVYWFGWDNVQLTWQGTSSSYPTDKPTINPVNSHTVSEIDFWTSFTEVATKNGGEIYYQLSDDDGSTWYYWTGSGWSSAGVSNYNTASVINTNISSFPTTTAKFMFKAFLESDGSQAVELNNVKVGWGEEIGGGGYATNGYLISSAFNMNTKASVNIIEFTPTIPACSPACEIKLQVRTASDAGGSPGAWTNWYGASGSGTYFTNPSGTIISTDLNFNQWVQYRAELIGDGIDTPLLNAVKINYLP